MTRPKTYYGQWVIIAGSRDLDDYNLIEEAIKASRFEINGIVSGMARGVDNNAYMYAMMNDIDVKQFPADWDKHGKRAGYLRNIEMSKFGDALIAIWDGKSIGTSMMIDIMERAHKPIYVHEMWHKN